MKNQPTLFDDVNKTVSMLLFQSKDILRDHFIAMYLHGSLATGDFNPETSDVDFVIITTSFLSDVTIQELRIMHKSLMNQFPVWGERLEGSFVSKDLLKQGTPPTEPRPYINQKSFNIAPYGYEWALEKHVLREKSIALTGIPASTFIAPVSLDEIRGAVINLLRYDWEPLLREPSRLHDSGYPEYTILTMCRCLYTIENNGIVSKKVAAEWVQNRFPEWKGLIGSVWNETAGIEKVQEYISYVISRTE
ncbi:MAG: DUF4111 domain-containing protein [Brevinematales bacterium]|nr:DUF4111 domain-containing protein [Brevinematales bacterium]